MEPSVGDLLATLLARVVADGEHFRAAHAPTGNSGGWFVTVLSVVALLAASGIVARVVARLASRSAPELTTLLNRSAAFYARWPQDALSGAPRHEVVAEAARCRRIVELLEARTRAGSDDAPALTGCIAGMRSWIALLGSRIERSADIASGASYA